MRKTPATPVINGLYAITPDGLSSAELLRRTRLALTGGVRVLQYRNKSVDSGLKREQALALRGLTHEFGAVLIINDDAGLAAQIAADGVHLGADDGEISAARAQLGSGRLIGVSCYNQPELARRAQAQGADYVAFGAFFPSGVKPGAVRATPDLLRQMRRELDLPLVAIGGIDTNNGGELIEAGAHALAVISALFGAADIQRTAQQFSTLFSEKRHDLSQSATV